MCWWGEPSAGACPSFRFPSICPEWIPTCPRDNPNLKIIVDRLGGFKSDCRFVCQVQGVEVGRFQGCWHQEPESTRNQNRRGASFRGRHNLESSRLRHPGSDKPYRNRSTSTVRRDKQSREWDVAKQKGNAVTMAFPFCVDGGNSRTLTRT